MCISCRLGNPIDHFRAERTGFGLDTEPTIEPGAPASIYEGETSGGVGALFETGDFAGSVATTATLTLNDTAYGRIGAAGDSDWIRINLVAGQTYELRLHGIGANELVDPYLRLRNAAGTQIAENDDSGSATWGGQSGLDSRIVFTATTTGVHYLDVQGFNSTATGDYIVSLAQQFSGGMSFTTDEIAWQLVSNGWNFFGGNTRSFNVGADGSLTVNITNLTAEGQFLARNALRTWTDLTGIAFVEVGGAAEISFDDNAATVTAFANSAVSGSTITSSTVQISLGWINQFGTTLNSYSFETYIHEIGHALGLAHGGNYNGSANYGTDNFYLNDGLAMSVMSYMQARNDEFAGPNTFIDASFRYMLTPSLADQVAIQYLYGDRGTAYAGNTVYGYGSNTGNAVLDQFVTLANGNGRTFMMVWDEGGVDALNFASFAGDQVIRLSGESFSNVIGGVSNLAIARGVTIENAFGGSGNDRITGNQVGNLLSGNAGNDTIDGADGDDSIAGGAGADTIIGGAGNDFLYGDGENDTVFGGDGLDTIYLGSGDDYALSEGGASSILAGEAGNDTLYGGAGDDYMVGGDGNDLMVGQGGVNSMFGGVGNDTLIAGDGAGSVLDGGSGANQLWGGSGGDYMVGGELADTIVGGAGSDLIFGNAGSDAIYAGVGSDYIYGNSGNEFIYTDDVGVQNRDYVYVGGGTGTDTIVDFTAGDGANTDVLVVALGNGISNFAQAQQAMTQAGFYTVLTLFGGDQVFLYNVAPAQLTANNFIFL